jgi:hypothetical protein
MTTPRMIESMTKPRNRHQNPAMSWVATISIGPMGASGGNDVGGAAALELGAPQDAQNR